VRRFRFSRRDGQRLVDLVAGYLNLGEPTAFARSSISLYVIRSSLCLIGWPWSVANETAASIVTQALNQLGARRPSWAEGQREFTALGNFLREDFCWECGDALPKYAKKFCNGSCAQAYRARSVSAVPEAVAA
jgi:hypothetical protein